MRLGSQRVFTHKRPFFSVSGLTPSSYPDLPVSFPDSSLFPPSRFHLVDFLFFLDLLCTQLSKNA